jgi:hypothetical protein
MLAANEIKKWLPIEGAERKKLEGLLFRWIWRLLFRKVFAIRYLLI